MTPRTAVAVVFAVNGALYGAWATRVPWIKDRLDLSAGELGIALGAIALGAILAMPLAGAWAAHAGSLRATRVWALAFCCATPLLVLAPAYGWLVAGAALLGACAASLDVSMNAHGVLVEERLGRPVLSGMHAAFSGGGLAGAATGAAVAGAEIDARTHLLVAAAIGLSLIAAAWRGLAGAGEGRAEAGHRFARPTGALWALGALAFCCLLAEGAAADWSAVYVDEDLAAGAGTAGLAYACFSACMLVGRLAGDRLAEAYGSVRLLRVGGAVAGTGLAVALMVSAPVAALLGFAALGLGLSVVVPVVFRSAAALPGQAGAPALAAVSTVGYAGFLAGPPLVGALAEATSLPVALGLVAACAAAPVALSGAARA